MVWVGVGLVWGSSAWGAGIPVVYDLPSGQTAAAVVSLVEQRTGLPADQLEAIPLSTVLKAAPRALGAAALRHCAGEPTRMQDIRAELVRAEGALSQRDPGGASDQLDLAVAKLACLQELMEPPVVARVFLLRGGLAAQEGREAEARAELRTALSLSPEVTWPPGLLPEGAALLEAERATPASLRVRAYPPEISTGPWLDGQVLSGPGQETRPGLHLVQTASAAGIRSAWMVVGEAQTALVIPESYRSPVLSRLSQPERQEEVALLVLAALPTAPAVYVSHGGGLWLVTPGEGAALAQIETLTPPQAEAQPSAQRLPWWRRLWPARAPRGAPPSP